MKQSQRELQDWQKRFVCHIPIDRKVSVVTAKGQFNQPDLNVIGQFEISFRLVYHNQPFTLDDVLPKIAKAIRDGVKDQYKLVKKREIVGKKKKTSPPSGYGGGEGLHDRPW